MTLKFLIPILAACALTAFAAEGPTPSDALNQIHHINQKEIHMAHVALTNSQNPQVKDFANRMIKDHTSADRKTEHVARLENIDLKSFTPSPQEKVEMNRIAHLKGAQFDTAYMDAMKTGHQQALRYLNSTEQQTQNKAVKSLITQLIPTVQHHETLATDIASNLNPSNQEAAGEAAVTNDGGY